MTRNNQLALVAATLLLVLVGIAAWAQPWSDPHQTPPEAIASAPSATPGDGADAASAPVPAAPQPTSAMPPSMGSGVAKTEDSWLILPELPADATQADYGAEIYRLVCSACHGDEGQGLTPEWRAEWAPDDQNCWQSKCHAGNHPPDGFVLPRDIPALIGPGTLTRFENTLALYNFIRTTMPWQNPGSLQDEEYWQITTFLAREHEVSVGNLPFDEVQAAEQLLSR